MTFSSPLTRSALRKLSSEVQQQQPQLSVETEPHKLKLAAGASTAAVADEAPSVSLSATAGVHKRSGADRELLIQEYTAYQHGLTATKRRRASRTLIASPTSSSQGASDLTVETLESEPAPETPVAAKSSCDSATASSEDASAVEPSPSVNDTPERSSGASTALPLGRAVSAPLPTPASMSAAPPVVSVAVATLSQEEKHMDGAPEGELFLVTVLTRDEIAPSQDIETEAQALGALLESRAKRASESGDVPTDAGDSAVSWATEYAAVDSLRRFAIHHPSHLKQHVKRALPLVVCPAVSSLRSAMTRNALLCIQDIFLCLQDDVADSFDAVLPLLLSRASSEKQFIRDLAHEALATAVATCADDALLLALLRMSVAEKNPQAVNVIGQYVHKCIMRMDRALLKTFVLETHASFVAEMSALLSCKVVACKAATRTSLQYTRTAIGDTEFVALVKCKLAGSAQFDVLRASERKLAPAKRATGAGASTTKLSMRERMLQMRKQQLAQGKASSAVFDVVVAAPPPPPQNARSASS